jgi:thiamine biosynthesis lipoprotein
MGTLFFVTLYATNAPAAQAAADAAFQRINALEDIMSDYQADSELMLLCDKPAGTPVPVSPDLFDILSRAQQIAAKTDGAFDATIGPCVRLWRFARKRKVLPSAQELAAARALVGYHKLVLDPGEHTATLTVPNMRLDLGGIGKGYAADQAMNELRRRGISRALVAASGDIAIGDPPPGQPGWRVGISKIDARTNDLAEMLLLKNCAVSTSGDTEQFILIDGVRYSHIIDPRTGLGLTNRVQATVVAPNATITDSLDTSLCILGPTRALECLKSFPHASALLFEKKGDTVQRFVSPGFQKLTKAPTGG